MTERATSSCAKPASTSSRSAWIFPTSATTISRFPGLYSHLKDLVPRLTALGHDDIVLNSCITSENVGEINAIADQARAWGANLCYSAYSARRTGCRDYF
jgi:hypothetical protein